MLPWKEFTWDKINVPPILLLKQIFRVDKNSGDLYRVASSDGSKLFAANKCLSRNSEGEIVVPVIDSFGKVKYLKAELIKMLILSL